MNMCCIVIVVNNCDVATFTQPPSLSYGNFRRCDNSAYGDTLLSAILGSVS